MNNTIARFGRTCASLLIGGGLLTGGLFAATTNLVTVTLPCAVTVGNVTLPAGSYSISSVDMAGSEDMLLIRADKGHAFATIQAQKMLGAQVEKTQVVLAKEGDNWGFDKLVIQGEGVSYQFAK